MRQGSGRRDTTSFGLFSVAGDMVLVSKKAGVITQAPQHSAEPSPWNQASKGLSCTALWSMLLPELKQPGFVCIPSLLTETLLPPPSLASHIPISQARPQTTRQSNTLVW